MPSISVIIPAYNEEQYIAACLKTMLENRHPDVREIIVVDNASTDRTAEIAGGFPDVRVVREERKGTSFARERGFREAKADLLAFIDADSSASQAWFSRALGRFEQNGAVVCVSGPFFCYDIARSINMLSLIYWWLLAVPASLMTGRVAVGGGMMIRRVALERVGGFDTSVAFYGDDTSIARKLRGVGRVRFDPNLIIWSSGRRFANEGFMKVGWRYATNFWSQILAGKSMTKNYRDVR